MIKIKEAEREELEEDFEDLNSGYVTIDDFEVSENMIDTISRNNSTN